VNDLRKQVKRIVSEVSRIDESEFEDEVLIREELGIDSLMGMEIIANCEKALDIHIDESLFAEIETVGDFLRMIEKLYEHEHPQP
jgi:acyl carrier protein